jgi:hypothetical protein
MTNYTPVIPKIQLITGAYYNGRCRNTTLARWNGKKFIYQRTKFGDTYFESICCPEDDSVYDVFIATSVCENPEIVLPLTI